MMLAPFAPHLGEELWQMLGHTDTITYEPWPTFNPEFLVQREVEVLVQLCGKPRVRLMMPAEAEVEEMQKIALADPDVRKFLAGKTIRKVFGVKGRLVNIVAN